jgi:hypothetical protein
VGRVALKASLEERLVENGGVVHLGVDLDVYLLLGERKSKIL